MAAATWSWLLAPFLLLHWASAGAGGGAGGSGAGLSGPAVFTSSFLVRFRRGVDNSFAHDVADKYGFDNLGPVSGMCEKSIIILPTAGLVARFFWAKLLAFLADMLHLSDACQALIAIARGVWVS